MGVLAFSKSLEQGPQRSQSWVQAQNQSTYFRGFFWVFFFFFFFGGGGGGVVVCLFVLGFDSSPHLEITTAAGKTLCTISTFDLKDKRERRFLSQRNYSFHF